MENITHLDLSNSNLISISNDVMESMVKNLKTLKLVNNNLEILPQSIMEANNETKLWLSNNSYECNCDMMWMRDWLVKATNIIDKEVIVCRKGKMIGKHLNLLPPANQVWDKVIFSQVCVSHSVNGGVSV